MDGTGLFTGSSRAGRRRWLQGWLVDAVCKGGSSGHQAAAQFGVRRLRETGSVEPAEEDSWAASRWLVQRCRKADFTLRGMVAEFAECGLRDCQESCV